MRVALLLVGGNKVGDDQFYERVVPIADKIFDTHLAALKREMEARRGKKKEK